LKVSTQNVMTACIQVSYTTSFEGQMCFLLYYTWKKCFSKVLWKWLSCF